MPDWNVGFNCSMFPITWFQPPKPNCLVCPPPFPLPLSCIFSKRPGNIEPKESRCPLFGSAGGISSHLFAFIACTSGVKVENPSEGDDNGVVNVGRLIHISIDTAVCTETTDIEGIEVGNAIEIDGWFTEGKADALREIPVSCWYISFENCSSPCIF